MEYNSNRGHRGHCRAYVLEFLTKEGDVNVAEISFCFSSNEDDEQIRDLADDFWDYMYVKEFPEAVFGDFGSDWEMRCGVTCSIDDVENCGGVYYGETDPELSREKEPSRYRVRRVWISGEPSEEFAKWLDEHPCVAWSVAPEFVEFCK